MAGRMRPRLPCHGYRQAHQDCRIPKNLLGGRTYHESPPTCGRLKRYDWRKTRAGAGVCDAVDGPGGKERRVGRISTVIGGAYRTVAGAAGSITSAAGGAVQTAATQITFASIERAVRGASGGNDPAALRDTAVTALRSLVTGDAGQAREARERAAHAIAQAQNEQQQSNARRQKPPKSLPRLSRQAPSSRRLL
jgi:hypothetical protein